MFKYKVGDTHLTQEGGVVKILGRNDELTGYETLVCSDGLCRYDRSTSNTDAGRVTGSPHDYSYPANFVREELSCV